MGLWIQNFKQALRGLRHQGWQAVVSVVGLAVSTVCLDVQRGLTVDGGAL